MRVPNMARIGLKVSPNRDANTTVTPVISERIALKQQAI